MTELAGEATAIFDLLLLVALLALAVVAVVVPRRSAAAAAFLVFGVVLALLWARLDAPDIALAEAALGGGVAGALLVDSLGSARPPSAGRAPVWAWLVGGLGGAGVLAGLVVAVRALPEQNAPLGEEVLTAVEATGVSHPVTAVLLDLRSYDTLLEVAVVVVAVIGALAVSRRPPARAPRPSKEVSAVAVVLLPLLVLLAVWLLVAGTTRPGGAFQSGALLGAALVMAHLAGLDRAVPRGRAQMALVVAGLLVFLAVAGVTAGLGGWLDLDPTWGGTVVLAVEAALAVSIATALATLFLANRADDDPAEDPDPTDQPGPTEPAIDTGGKR